MKEKIEEKIKELLSLHEPDNQMQIYNNGKFAAYKEILELLKESVTVKEVVPKNKKDIFISFLNNLQEPYRSRSLVNLDENFTNIHNTPTSVVEAVLYAFSWTDSPQGDQYWRTLYNEL